MAIPLIGTRTALVGGTLTLALPAQINFWYIQNQDVSPLKVTFLGARKATFSSIVLNSAAQAGEAGGYIDSVGFPYFDTLGLLLTSAIATAQFGSGASGVQPVNNFPYPGNNQ